MQIDNRLVTLSHSDPAIKTFHNTDGKWRPLDKTKLVAWALKFQFVVSYMIFTEFFWPRVQIDDSVLAKTSELLQQKAYYELVDFDNHLDNISLDWKNAALNDQIDDVEV